MLVKDNKYIPNEDKDFFILLRIGLWQKVEEPLSEAPDWEYIYNLSVEQTVHGIIADGIGIYRKEHLDLGIPQYWNDKFLSSSAQIVRQNVKINQLLSQICKLFNEQGINYIIMKGQPAASCYPKPLLRCSGDIDCYFDDDNYEKAKKLLEPIAEDIDPEHNNRRHCGYFINGIEIELHVDEADTINRQEAFNKLLNKVFCNGIDDYYICNGVTVKTAPASFDVAYIFLHIMIHYYLGGISVRQMCDLALALNNRRDEIDKTQLFSYLSTLNLKCEWNFLLQFLVEYLGLPQIVCDKFKVSSIFNVDSVAKFKQLDSKSIWLACKKSGNFGQNEIEQREEMKINPQDSFSERNKKTWINEKNKFNQSFKIAPSKAILDFCDFITYNIKKAFRKSFHIGGEKFNI